MKLSPLETFSVESLEIDYVIAMTFYTTDMGAEQLSVVLFDIVVYWV